MKHIIYITLLLISFNGVAQEYADKEYYLVDSLLLDELTHSDKDLLENSLKLFHSNKDVFEQINSLNNVCEKMVSQEWIKYQFFQYELINKALKEEHPQKSKKDTLLISLSGALNNIGYIQLNQGNYLLALKFYNKSIKIKEDLNDMDGMAATYNNIGMTYHNQGDIPNSLKYYHLSLKIRERINDKKGMADSYNNIGLIHNQQGDVDLALEFYQKSLKIREQINDKKGLATSYSNIGFIYQDQENIKLAFEYYYKALNLREEIKDKKDMASSYNNIGYLHQREGDFTSALDLFKKSLEIRKEIKDKKGIATCLNNIGKVMLDKGDVETAKENSLKSLDIARKIGYTNGVKTAANLLGTIYEIEKNGKKALEMYKLFIVMRDSLDNQKSQKAAAKQQAKYGYEKQKTIDDAAHDKLMAIEQEEKEKQKILTAATAGGLGLVGVFLIFVFNRLRVTKKQKLIIEEQKYEVEQQKEVVELAHSELEEKNQEIMDSITYAKRIQLAILPPIKLVKEYLRESFILYKPKDVVAGDFYWMEHKNGKVLYAAADCTGHGVPGAMVSVVCNNGLNRSVREYGLTDPGQILDKTREIVIQEFEKSEEEVKDGMDIALCSIEDKKLQYAGAHNPLWIIRKGEIIETKANKQPIGQFDNPEPYTTHSFDLESGDSIYIFSDGYVDQFGGEKGKKFKSKAFRELLLSIQDKAMEEQKTIIDESFEIWRGNLEQVDDVCVIGVRV